jgi:16S rRNA G966 N2-methylase RsmD
MKRFPDFVSKLSKKYGTIDYGRLAAAEGSAIYSTMPHHINDEIKIIKRYAIGNSGEHGHVNRDGKEHNREHDHGNRDSHLIIDATANCGATTISVAMALGVDMIAIELDPPTCEVLRRNVAEFARDLRSEISVVCGNSLEFLRGFRAPVDIILIDAPWGGSGYDKVEHLMLYMNDENGEPVPLYSVANLAFAETSCRHVILKVPRNFDMVAFTENFAGSYDLHHILRKFAPKPGQSIIDYNLIACRR